MGDAVSVLPPVTVALRPAGHDDCRRIWLWRNDEQTRRVSLDSAPIAFENHERWFQATLRSPDHRAYIIEAGGEAAGVVRLDLEGEQATVSINLAPEWRGRGVGPPALERLAELAFGTLGLNGLVASVKADNRASLAAFEKAGFTPSGRGATVTLHRSRA
jgi:RimJ/RimL family protein N-acetyltransferase